MRPYDWVRRARVEQRRVYRLGFEAGVVEVLDALSRGMVVLGDVGSGTVVHVDRHVWQRLMGVADDAEPDGTGADVT